MHNVTFCLFQTSILLVILFHSCCAFEFFTTTVAWLTSTITSKFFKASTMRPWEFSSCCKTYYLTNVTIIVFVLSPCDCQSKTYNIRASIYYNNYEKLGFAALISPLGQNAHKGTTSINLHYNYMFFSPKIIFSYKWILIVFVTCYEKWLELPQ